MVVVCWLLCAHCAFPPAFSLPVAGLSMFVVVVLLLVILVVVVVAVVVVVVVAVLYGCDDGKIAWWDVEGHLLHVLDAHKSAVVCLQWFDNTRVLMSGGRDGAIYFWRFPGGDEQDEIPYSKSNTEVSRLSMSAGLAVAAPAPKPAAEGKAVVSKALNEIPGGQLADDEALTLRSRALSTVSPNGPADESDSEGESGILKDEDRKKIGKGGGSGRENESEEEETEEEDERSKSPAQTTGALLVASDENDEADGDEADEKEDTSNGASGGAKKKNKKKKKKGGR